METRTGGFCGTCYLDAIERLCNGFAIVRPDGTAVTAVPPLDPQMAASVRRAARRLLEDRGQGTAPWHPHNGITGVA